MKCYTLKKPYYVNKLHPPHPPTPLKWEKKGKAQLKLHKIVFLFIQVAGDAHHQRFFRAINNLRREVIFKLAEP